MLANLNKNKELVKQAQQKQNQEQIFDIIQEVVKEKPKQVEKKVEIIQESIKVQYSSMFTVNYDKEEEDKASIEAKEFMANIQKLSTYANPYFLKYFGIQITGKQKQKKVETIETPLITKKEEQKQKQPLLKEAQNTKKQGKQPKQVQDKRTSIKILSEPNLNKFTVAKYKGQPKTKSQFSQRLSTCLQILEAVSSLHSLSFTIFPNNLEDIILLQDQNLKLAIHSSRIWRLVTQDHLSDLKTKQMGKIKKVALANISMKYKSPEFMLKPVSIKDVRRNDVWKTGILLITILSGQDLNKEVLALESIDQTKIKEHKLVDEARITRLKKYCRIEDINEILKSISILPSERPQLVTLIPLFRRLRSQTTQFIDAQSLQQAQRHYFKQKESQTFKYMPQLKPTQQLFSADHKKKVSQYFKGNQNRIVKDYKLLYRASNTQFSCKSFYHVAFDKKNLLIIFMEKTGKKLIAYSQQTFDLNKCNGIFGGFIKDSKKQSFIYSPQQNQFCKLKNPQKAIGVSHIQGPIIGDGDIVISDGGLYNISRFPGSYQSLKLKRLLKTQRFELSEYDVYQVTF